jgi:hypothetical protein
MEPVRIDVRDPSLATILASLEAVAGDLRTLWAAAVERSDFAEVTRLVGASHAVHRALLTLGEQPVIAAGTAERPSGRAVATPG